MNVILTRQTEGVAERISKLGSWECNNYMRKGFVLVCVFEARTEDDKEGFAWAVLQRPIESEVEAKHEEMEKAARLHAEEKNKLISENEYLKQRVADSEKTIQELRESLAAEGSVGE